MEDDLEKITDKKRDSKRWLILVLICVFLLVILLILLFNRNFNFQPLEPAVNNNGNELVIANEGLIDNWQNDEYICSTSNNCYEKMYKLEGIVCNLDNVEFISRFNEDISSWTSEQRNESSLNYFSWECINNSCVCVGDWYKNY